MLFGYECEKIQSLVNKAVEHTLKHSLKTQILLYENLVSPKSKICIFKGKANGVVS